MQRFICFLLVVHFAMSALAQSRVDIRFNAVELEDTHTCIDFEIRSLENTDVLLAGQNYRIYFNPDKATLDETSLKSYSDTKRYSNLMSLTKHHSDEIDIAMINLAVDAKEYDVAKATILKPNTWTKTSAACFNHSANAQFDLEWARPKRTGDLATAFVELSEWKSAQHQESIVINEYYDFDNGQIENQELFTPQISVYPNPVVDILNFDIGPFGELNEGQILVVNTSGHQVSKQNINKGTTSYQFDMKDAPLGSYIVEILNDENKSVFHSKFVKSSL